MALKPASPFPPSPVMDAVSDYVMRTMAHYDPSHDGQHIQRVVDLSSKLLAREQELNTQSPKINYNISLVHLAALAHDLTDHKYLPATTNAASALEGLHSLLVSLGVESDLARKTCALVPLVSYSKETTPAGAAKVQAALDPSNPDGYIPELGIVQDADRLEAIGAVGIGRCFTFTGAGFERKKAKMQQEQKQQQQQQQGRGMEDALIHFEEKLVRVEGMMKTRAGKEFARERTERIRMFMGWWKEETGFDPFDLE